MNLTKQCDGASEQTEAGGSRHRTAETVLGQYAAAIKQAQADNDMQKAQALYDAAKKEDEQILAYKKQAASLWQAREFRVRTGNGTGNLEVPGTATPTHGTKVLKNEQGINDIYNAKDGKPESGSSDGLSAGWLNFRRSRQSQRQTVVNNA